MDSLNRNFDLVGRFAQKMCNTILLKEGSLSLLINRQLLLCVTSCLLILKDSLYIEFYFIPKTLCTEYPVWCSISFVKYWYGKLEKIWKQHKRILIYSFEYVFMKIKTLFCTAFLQFLHKLKYIIIFWVFSLVINL